MTDKKERKSADGKCFIYGHKMQRNSISLQDVLEHVFMCLSVSFYIYNIFLEVVFEHLIIMGTLYLFCARK